MLPVGQQFVESLSDRLGHLLEAVDTGGFGFFAPKQERRAGEFVAIGQFVDVAQILLHHRGGSEVLKLEPELLQVVRRRG